MHHQSDLTALLWGYGVVTGYGEYGILYALAYFAGGLIRNIATHHSRPLIVDVICTQVGVIRTADKRNAMQTDHMK